MSRLLETGLTLCALAAAGAATVGAHPAPDPADARQVVAAPETYRLTANGGGGACTLRRGPSVAPARLRIAVAPGCDALFPGLSRATLWEERADDSVVLRNAAGKAIAVFGAGDGVAYQSFAPRAPLLAMSELD